MRRAPVSEPSSPVRLFDEIQEDVALEDAGVVREQAKHGPHQEPLQVVPPVAGLEQRVVQLAHQFGGADVDGVLIAECPAPHAEDEAERLDVAGQFLKREADLFAFAEIVKLERLEIADEDVAGALVFGQGVEILPGLPVGLAEIATGALLLDDQDAGPEEIDEAGAVVELGDVVLVAGDRAPPDAEHPEEVVVEALRLAGLVLGLAPFAGEFGGPDADLVPGQAHGYRASLMKWSLWSA